jgi:hypothetical protein
MTITDDAYHRALIQLLRDIERHYQNGGTMADFDAAEDEQEAVA